MHTEEITPKIYVACLSAYNLGYLYGAWIDANQSAEEIIEEINQMLSRSPLRVLENCEEWAIHDYENFYQVSITEYQDLETISIFANAISKHGEAISGYIESRRGETNQDWEKIIEEFEDYYCGHYESEYDFIIKSSKIEDLFNWKDLQEKFPFWAGHIDWESISRDLFLGGEYYSIKADSYGYHIFRN